jgi:prepilin peptidase CpaA
MGGEWRIAIMGGSVTHLNVYAAALFSIMAAAFDLAWRRIPNAHVLFGGILALGIAVFESGLSGLGVAFAGAAVAGVLMLPGYISAGVADGDIKTMVVIGAFAGPRMAFSVALLSMIVGGFIAIIWLIAGRGTSEAPESKAGSEAGVDQPASKGESDWCVGVSYGPAIAIGSLLAFAWESLL